MNKWLYALVRIGLLALTLIIWSWALEANLSPAVDRALILGAVLLVFPVVWIGRRLLDQHPTPEGAVAITTPVHFALMILFGVAIPRAVLTHGQWTGWRLPVPQAAGLLLVLSTGAAAVLSVVNLALRGLGAPFAIALSRRLSVDWLYSWTRNPMVLATLAFLVSLGLWYRSTLFCAWVLLLVSPALLVFVKVYEERELEIRFGQDYRDYRAHTPFLLPRRPRR